MADLNTSADCTTVIGGDAIVKGEVIVDKGLRVDGQIEGAVSTKGKVFVGKTGQLKAEIHAGMVSIEGKVTGNVTATDRVQIDASGLVYGDLTAGKLVVSEGATFVGKVNVGPDAVKDISSRESGIPAPVAARMGNLVGAGKDGNGKH